MNIWESDKACLEARDAVMAKATKGTHSRPMSATAREALREHKTALDDYARAVAVACYNDLLRREVVCFSRAGDVVRKMLAELGG